MASAAHSRGDFRTMRSRGSLRDCASALLLDEVALAGHVKPLLARQDSIFKANLTKGIPHQEALLACSRAFQEEFSKLCMEALLRQDRGVIALAAAHSSHAPSIHEALHYLRILGKLSPPWLSWRRGRS